MSEQGMKEERRFLAPRPRWGGTMPALGGVIYVVVGARLWGLR